MTFRWQCEGCGEIHGTNVDRCRSCGTDVFRPLTLSDLDASTDRRGDAAPLPEPTLDELLGGGSERTGSSGRRIPSRVVLFVLGLAFAMAAWYLLVAAT